MSPALKRNAVIAFGLAVLFDWSFMFAKHDPALRAIIPFGEDPYDAVGSFAFIVVPLIALLSLVRAFWPYRNGEPTRAQLVYLVRSQTAIVLAALVTLASDAVAMARYPSMWSAAASRNELIVLLIGMAVLAAAVLGLILGSREGLPARGSHRWKWAALVLLPALLVLVSYPERWIRNTAFHLVTVVVGAVVLFAPMRPLLLALVPYDEQLSKAPTRSSARRIWGLVLLLGIMVGVFAFAGEMSAGGSRMPLGRLLYVASVFIGLGSAGILVAYAFLAKPLGLASWGLLGLLTSLPNHATSEHTPRQ